MHRTCTHALCRGVHREGKLKSKERGEEAKAHGKMKVGVLHVAVATSEPAAKRVIELWLETKTLVSQCYQVGAYEKLPLGWWPLTLWPVWYTAAAAAAAALLLLLFSRVVGFLAACVHRDDLVFSNAGLAHRAERHGLCLYPLVNARPANQHVQRHTHTQKKRQMLVIPVQMAAQGHDRVRRLFKANVALERGVGVLLLATAAGAVGARC